MPAFTLFELAGRRLAPPPLAEATLILIDYQNVYREGPLALTGADAAIDRARRLLDAARAAGARIIHVAHQGAPGGLFDRSRESGAIIDALAPLPGEAIVEKPRPNAFSGTALADLLGGPQPLVIAGFMTHNCVSSTVRAALDFGHAITIAGDACATRALPGPGGDIDGQTIHRAELAALGDHHALIMDVAALTKGVVPDSAPSNEPSMPVS
jgi:nicotinamidase-related amidase